MEYLANLRHLAKYVYIRGFLIILLIHQLETCKLYIYNIYLFKESHIYKKCHSQVYIYQYGRNMIHMRKQYHNQ